MALTKHAVRILEETSRTFYVPVMRLPEGLRDAVGAAYLCMRGIDEIEDHPDLASDVKARLLGSVSLAFQAVDRDRGLEHLYHALEQSGCGLPEVTLRLGEHARMAPEAVAPRVWDATSAMADRMAYWARANWDVRTEEDLNAYTYSVAGAIGLLLCDLWAWFDGTCSNRADAVGFGRGLQAVNILRNREEDLARGVDYYPAAWDEQEMHRYVRRNLALGDAYIEALPNGPARDFCRIPLALAYGTVEALARGEEKLDRQAVVQLIAQVTGS